MFGLFQNRKKYNGQVDLKLNNEYQIITRRSENPLFPGSLAFLELIDQAWNGQMNEDEAAMFIAVLYFSGLCKNGHRAEASLLLPRIVNIAQFNVPKNIVSEQRWQKFAHAIREAREISGI
ncbi:hypothetical protein NAV33_21335 [Pseudomonas stutzeri]|uniref:hypothetical protein n=1 Tax=Stutzerimonas stutzeri TaxID=316 RepID=UPI00210AA79D|nr:hypothetical protein [Stutzerimonas stutzeri]MCQ4314410.1 hypothetical protein [Stutzerimonas stutzeri]